ncbi:hypothetical protein [Taklimakanibacter deserti]|uniref:hypothetical protein n=1 Tax=Taklimakanibacter deserti TaxID=2267839 RepID=UPI000E6594FE
MPDFEVLSVSSEADPEDGCLILLLGGQLDGTPGSCQFKVEGVRAKVTRAPDRDVLAYNAVVGDQPLNRIKQHLLVEVSPDGSTMRWTIETDGGEQTLVMSLEVARKFLRHMEAAIGLPPAEH